MFGGKSDIYTHLLDKQEVIFELKHVEKIPLLNILYKISNKSE